MTHTALLVEICMFDHLKIILMMSWIERTLQLNLSSTKLTCFDEVLMVRPHSALSIFVDSFRSGPRLSLRWKPFGFPIGSTSLCLMQLSNDLLLVNRSAAVFREEMTAFVSWSPLNMEEQSRAKKQRKHLEKDQSEKDIWHSFAFEFVSDHVRKEFWTTLRISRVEFGCTMTCAKFSGPAKMMTPLSGRRLRPAVTVSD
jgi:hypothetical protein